MPDYLEIPKAVNSTNEGYYQSGVTLFSREGIGDWKIAYTGSSDYALHVGTYNDYGRQIFIVMSPIEIPYQEVDIRVVSPTFVTAFKYPAIILDSVFGWWGTMIFTPDGFSTNLTVFDTLEETQEAIGFGTSPGTDSDIVVTAIASPLEPSTEGVIVYAVAQLLDPNQQGGTAKPGGGQGTFDDTSDPIPVPELPAVSVVDTGLVTLFRPSRLELSQLGAYLWTHLTDFWENLQKLFTNPMDYFIAFNIFPVSPNVGESRKVFIGNWGTDIYMQPVTNQWYEFDCGTVFLTEYWGSALDYMPNTKVQLMLPYIGSVQLNTDEVMGNRIGVKYRIDLLSGSCVAMITVNDNVYYQFTGECAVSVPLTGSDWSRIYSATVGAIGTAIAGGVGAVATGNAGGAAMSAFAAGKAVKAASSAGNTFARLATNHTRGAQEAREAVVTAIQASAQAAQNAATASGTVANGIRATRLANSVNNTVGQVMSGKSVISHSGTISGSSGMLGVRNAYLIIEYPNQSLADKYRHFVGYPSNMYARLGDLHGYTEVEQVIPEGIWGTDDELAELVESLKGGVYLV